MWKYYWTTCLCRDKTNWKSYSNMFQLYTGCAFRSKSETILCIRNFWEKYNTILRCHSQKFSFFCCCIDAFNPCRFWNLAHEIQQALMTSTWKNLSGHNIWYLYLFILPLNSNAFFLTNACVSHSILKTATVKRQNALALKSFSLCLIISSFVLILFHILLTPATYLYKTYRLKVNLCLPFDFMKIKLDFMELIFGW